VISFGGKEKVETRKQKFENWKLEIRKEGHDVARLLWTGVRGCLTIVIGQRVPESLVYRNPSGAASTGGALLFGCGRVGEGVFEHFGDAASRASGSGS